MSTHADSDCSILVNGLLPRVAPERGYAALLLKHPAAKSYFPFAIAKGVRASAYRASLLERYFLFSTDLEHPEMSEITLDDASPIEDLALRGKLALTLFDHGPVRLQYSRCGASGDTVLCQLARPGGHDSGTGPPHPDTCEMLAAATRLWQHVAPRCVCIDRSSPAQTAAETARVLSDAAAVPPYLAVLYAAVDWRETPQSSPRQGPWLPNALAYNCFLLAERNSLADSYIRAMFQDNSRIPARYDDLLGKVAGGVLEAIVTVCKDLVHLVGVCPETGARVYARRNIPRATATPDLLGHARYRRAVHEVDSNWQLLRSAIEYLHDRHDECALVTAWVGTASCQCPIPVGFVPGVLVDTLASAADHPAMARLKRDISSKGGALTASVVPLEYAIKSDASRGSWTAAAGIIDTILDIADGMAHDFPGPYLLDFHNGGPLHIARKNIEGRYRLITRERDQALWEFLFALHKAYSERKRIASEGLDLAVLPHKLIEAQWCTSSGARFRSAQDFVDAMNAKLREGNPRIDTKRIFQNKRGEGWFWTGESEARGYTLSVSSRGRGGSEQHHTAETEDEE